MANLATIQNSVLSTEQIEVLTSAGLIPKGTPSAQVAVYAKICTDKGLNPFTKEIYLVKTTSEKYGDIYTPMVGIDGWRKKIHEMGDYVGTGTKFNLTGKGEWKTMFEVEGEIIKWYNKEIPQRFDKTKTEIGKTVHQILMSGVYPLTCTVEVYRSFNGVKVPFSKTVSYREFAGISNWEKMPLQMIEKVAKAFSYKEALGEWASGLHLEEEKAAFEGSQAAMVLSESDLQKMTEKEAAQAEMEAAKAAQIELSNKLKGLKADFIANPTEANRDMIAAKIAEIPYPNEGFLTFADAEIKKILTAELAELQKVEQDNGVQNN